MKPVTLAYLRARRLLRAQAVSFWAAQALAVLEVLLSLALLVAGALLVGLLVGRGAVRLSGEQWNDSPASIRERVEASPAGEARFGDTGLTRLVVENQGLASPGRHRLLAGLLQSVVGAVRPLRTDVSALATLLAVGLGLLLLLLLSSVARRRIAIRLATGAAAALRRQIHRQMYRLGLSALLSQGIGPVLDLFTREVNDVRDILVLDLERTLRLPALPSGCWPSRWSSRSR